MSPWAEALGPVVITGFALQQLLDLSDPLLERIFKEQKALMRSALAFLASLTICMVLDLKALRPFGVVQYGWLDTLLTALVITGGTKWVNDLVKIMNYKARELRVRAAVD